MKIEICDDGVFRQLVQVDRIDPGQGGRPARDIPLSAGVQVRFCFDEGEGSLLLVEYGGRAPSPLPESHGTGVSLGTVVVTEVLECAWLKPGLLRLGVRLSDVLRRMASERWFVFDLARDPACFTVLEFIVAGGDRVHAVSSEDAAWHWVQVDHAGDPGFIHLYALPAAGGRCGSSPPPLIGACGEHRGRFAIEALTAGRHGRLPRGHVLRIEWLGSGEGGALELTVSLLDPGRSERMPELVDMYAIDVGPDGACRSESLLDPANPDEWLIY
ncbi:thiamine pyrophosphate-dependent enzyme [Thauera sinica]|uniref:Uncharacterized protein n=1 Tax=Thauera sinica TaxID=2665146 RepID=A0ABW1AKV9_9RHOO|nr:hypothetical protein [Thauera sp. K11]ATE59838.1 hypothetical protein CCZ27_07645 [Thauera sp. K11]